MLRSSRGAQRRAPAKINLGLHVLRKRPDGYHDIETVFVRIPWGDVLVAEPADEIRLACSDPTLPVDESNLVMKAARLLRRLEDEHRETARGHVRRGADMHLEKRLPIGSGLGGGSSDAASALLLLNDLWDLEHTREELAAVAAQIGSDVPFFLGPETALGTGRGELLEPLVNPDTDEPYRPPFILVVAVPMEQVSTPEAFAMVEPNDTDRVDLSEIVLSNDIDRWRRELVNDFEAPIFEKYPAVGEVKSALLQAGAGYASLSGSGAAVFGFFEGEDMASGAAEALRETGHLTWHGRL